MGIEKGKYDVELIRRTRELVASYKGKFNLTLLMNSLLSLVVLPSEHNKRRKLKFLDRRLEEIPEITYIFTSNNYYFAEHNGKRDLKGLLSRIRNGISHQHIDIINKIENGKLKWDGVKIQDIEPTTGTIKLNLELRTVELRRFSILIADSYLTEVNLKNQ